MPEWASVLVGVATGTVVTCVGVYYNEWLRDRRARRKQGAELIARVRVLLGDADPASFSLGTMRERNQRHGQELWRRWYELREYFLEFGLLGSEDEQAFEAGGDRRCTHNSGSTQLGRRRCQRRRPREHASDGEASSRPSRRGSSSARECPLNWQGRA